MEGNNYWKNLRTILIGSFFGTQVKTINYPYVSCNKLDSYIERRYIINLQIVFENRISLLIGKPTIGAQNNWYFLRIFCADLIYDLRNTVNVIGYMI